MRYPFESDEARELNKKIFETIYYGALYASVEISKSIRDKINSGKEDEVKFAINGSYEQFEKDKKRHKYKGAYSTFEGSPFSKGILQFDMWGIKPSDMFNWK